jgi:putative transposase
VKFITPGKQAENALRESFGRRFREDCLNENLFHSLPDAHRKIEAWRADYNRVRPHSSPKYETPGSFA